MQIDEPGKAGSPLITGIQRGINNGPPHCTHTHIPAIDVAKTDGQYITIRSFLLIQGIGGSSEVPGNLRPCGQTTVAKATCQLE